MAQPPPTRVPAPPTKAPPAKPAGKPVMPPAPKAPASSGPAAVPAKAFTIGKVSSNGHGEKIILYGMSGIGKSSLAAGAPDAVFIDLDHGIKNITHPVTGEPLSVIEGVETFEDTRSALQQPGLFRNAGFKTVVIDNITKVEELSDAYLFANYKKDGKAVNSIEEYGWGKGYRHSLEVMRLFLQDCDRLAAAGLNVVLLAQESAAVMSNAGGLDWLEAGPKVFHNKQTSTRLEVQEWAGHVLRIGYQETNVAGAVNATKGKIVSASTGRVIFAEPQRHFFAKSRVLANGAKLPPVVSYDSPQDMSLWTFMFPEGDPA